MDLICEETGFVENRLNVIEYKKSIEKKTKIMQKAMVCVCVCVCTSPIDHNDNGTARAKSSFHHIPHSRRFAYTTHAITVVLLSNWNLACSTLAHMPAAEPIALGGTLVQCGTAQPINTERLSIAFVGVHGSSIANYACSIHFVWFISNRILPNTGYFAGKQRDTIAHSSWGSAYAFHRGVN